MNANATANLVGITGIARRLVLDGALGEADARKALEESGKLKRPVHQYLLEKKLVTAAHVAGADDHHRAGVVERHAAGRCKEGSR